MVYIFTYLTKSDIKMRGSIDGSNQTEDNRTNGCKVKRGMFVSLSNDFVNSYSKQITTLPQYTILISHLQVLKVSVLPRSSHTVFSGELLC